MKSEFIRELINNKRLAFSEAADDELGDELSEEDNPFTEESEDIPEEEPIDQGFSEGSDDDLELEGEDSDMEEEPLPEPEPEPITKIHTIDIVSQVSNKFDLYMKETQLQWEAFTINGRIKKAPNFKFIEDLSTLLNKTFDEKDFRYIQIFNDLYNMLTDVNLGKSWNVYGRENYGKPYLAEAVALLMYELAVDWACVITRFYKESPKFSDGIPPEEDSFFKKFPNLNFLTFIAKLITESKEFKKLLTSEKAKGLLKEEGAYLLTAKQAKKKPGLAAAGESLSYYAGLVKENFGDITVGALDKLGTVCFLCSNTKMQMSDRLNIIERLIGIVSAKTTGPDANGDDPVIQALTTLDTTCIELVKNRADARITFDSSDKNYLLTNNNVR